MRCGLHDPKKGISQTSLNLYFRKENKKIQGTIFAIMIQKYTSPPYNYYSNFIIPFANILFPMLPAEWLHLALHVLLFRIPIIILD
jgi:hypothetical protein